VIKQNIAIFWYYWLEKSCYLRSLHNSTTRNDCNIQGKTVFAQLLEHLSLHQFRCCVKRYKGNCKVPSFTCLDQYPCLFFAQQTYRESRRDDI